LSVDGTYTEVDLQGDLGRFAPDIDHADILLYMIAGIGVDIVDTQEFRKLVDSKKDPFLIRIFTPAEISYAKAAPDPYQRLAARMAAKEAALKALGTGWTDEVDWHDLEITNTETGRPELTFSGGAEKRFHELSCRRVWLSISHTPTLCIAEVILETQDTGCGV
jgi:holo-[acyl-carrier protein] synthase